MRAMLAVLGDTCTHLASPMSGGTVISSTPPSMQMMEDGILVVTFGDPRQSGLLQQTMTQAKAGDCQDESDRFGFAWQPIRSLRAEINPAERQAQRCPKYSPKALFGLSGAGWVRFRRIRFQLPGGRREAFAGHARRL